MAANKDEIIFQIFADYSPNSVLKALQTEALSQIWEDPDKDHLVQLPTGYGKSAIAHLAGKIIAAKKEIRGKFITVLIEPLNLIMDDHVKTLREAGISFCSLDIYGNEREVGVGDESAEHEREGDFEHNCRTDGRMEDIASGKYELILAHPEALLKTKFGQSVLANQDFAEKVVCVVVDECHTIDVWGKEFRLAFKELHLLPSLLNCPVIGLSATLTTELQTSVPTALGMSDYSVVSASPDNPNLYYEVVWKPSNQDIQESASSVWYPLIEELIEKEATYPVTLAFVPLNWACDAQSELISRLGPPEIGKSRYAILFSRQDEAVKDWITNQLKLDNPFLRLVFCSPAVGMGFHSPSVSRVVHGRPTRNVIDLVQQVGRAGRSGQPAVSTVFVNNSDLGMEGVSEDIRKFCRSETCLREAILGCFGFAKQSAEFETLCKCCMICKSVCDCVVCEIE